MRPLLTLLLSGVCFCVFAQPTTIVKTDSSTIETKYYKDLESIRVFNRLIKSTRIYFTDSYYSSRKIKHKGTFQDGKAIGLWQEYDIAGKLIREIDYDHGVINYVDIKAYPTAKFQSKMQLKGDSILTFIYGESFVTKHLIWSIEGSYIRTDNESDNWIGRLKQKPYIFLLRYSVRLEGKVYPDLVEFEIDSSGNVLENEVEKVYGFEKIPAQWPRIFTLTVDNALSIARQRGLADTPSLKTTSFLSWQKNSSNVMCSGQFLFYVCQLTNSLDQRQTEGRSRIIDKFVVYIFNPWTGEFIEQKKMKTIRSWDQRSASSTGMLPDN